MRIIIPKNWVSVDGIWPTASSILMFLAGPIRGGGDWQSLMAKLLGEAIGGDLTIACPCRWQENHELARHFVRGPSNVFPHQLDWERHHLTLAGLDARPGCILFWLGLESEEKPHPGPEPYAMDTRRELGIWQQKIKNQGARVVIGADSRFHGLDTFRRDCSHELGYDFPIYSSMQDTIEAAIKMARRSE